jgi:hypothetical protein
MWQTPPTAGHTTLAGNWAGLSRKTWAFVREWVLAVVGAGVTTGLLLYIPFARLLISPALRVRLTLQPCYPLPVAIAVLAGLLSQWRFRSNAAFWVWVPQAVYLTYRMIVWVRVTKGGASLAVSHFLGSSCAYPSCNDQLESTLYLYMTLAYGLGALAFRFRRSLYGLRLSK